MRCCSCRYGSHRCSTRQSGWQNRNGQGSCQQHPWHRNRNPYRSCNRSALACRLSLQSLPRTRPPVCCRYPTICGCWITWLPPIVPRTKAHVRPLMYAALMMFDRISAAFRRAVAMVPAVICEALMLMALTVLADSFPVNMPFASM